MKKRTSIRLGLKLVILIFTLNMMSCSSKKEIIVFLDMIPFCDHIHFNAFIRKGMTKTDVMDLYGEPQFIYSFDSTGYLKLKDNMSGDEKQVPKYTDTENYIIRIKGYQKSPYPVTHRIIVYWGGFDAIAYVYISRDGKVEKKFIGGS